MAGIEIYATRYFLMLFIILGLEVMFYLTRQMKVKSVGYLQLMVCNIVLISVRDLYLEMPAQPDGPPLIIIKLIINSFWLGCLFYCLLCLEIIKPKHKLLIMLPQALFMAISLVYTIDVDVLMSGDRIAEQCWWLRLGSVLINLFYITLLTINIVKRLIAGKSIEAFMLAFITLSMTIIVFMPMGSFLNQNYLDVLTMDIVFYYGYCAIVAHYNIDRDYMNSRLELEKSKNSLLMAQIQPHFIFNSLMAIQAQCIDYPEIYNSVESFSQYLRSNLDSMGDPEPTTFDRELQHINAYLALEKLNYGDLLTVEYDICREDFVLPALSVEPLVENAVRHGIGTCVKGGKITISVKETRDFIVVDVKDHSYGEKNITVKQKNRKSIGIKNVRARLQAMNMGSLDISKNGDDTCARILLKKRFEEDMENGNTNSR